ncbi:MAG: 50S ribosomal protein L23 [Armatimonadetes bacterium]|nr:50S ribosomal protein L23 [Armatimonadota bacterium]MBS1704066.1 50S ribosomal protein L23 [Armatimonadota bacterium]MBS1725590.1 50S ribosomal protein L23 [Armatimonadota bacterium]
MTNPYDIIIAPHLTEKAVALSYGDPNIRDEEKIVRKYTFLVKKDANKIQIKAAIEALYNDGKKKNEGIEVTSVRTIKVLGKRRRRGRSIGYEPDRKKAIVTLKAGQMLEDFGV